MSFGAYEIVNAKTVTEDDSIKTTADAYYQPTFNDPDLPDFSPEGSVETILGNKIKNFFENKRHKKHLKQQEDLGDEIQEDVPKETESHASASSDEEVIKDSNKFKINADKITYDDADGNVYANGHVELIADSQGIKLCSDEAVLEKESQTIKLFGNVKVIKDNIEMTGEYLLVDLNEQNILMDNPSLEAYSFEINAQEAYMIADDIQMLNGTVKSNKESEIALETRGFQSMENVAMDYVRRRHLNRSSGGQGRKQTYEIKSKEIIVSRYKDHDSITLKGSSVYYNKHKIINKSDIEILSDKEYQVIETNSTEAGTLRNFGTYIGYGFINKLPKGQTLKLLPALTYGDSNIGVGIIARHKSRNSMLEAGYATSTTNLVVRGKYKLGNNMNISYGRNTYLPEGFMGARRSGYAAQFEYQKSFHIDDLDTNFNHGVYAGIFSDYEKHKQEEAYATTRFRYIAELRKKLLKYENKEQDLEISLSALAQTAATLYGSGETVGVARIGPYLTTRLKWWESSLGYMFAGVHGDSPFVFDKYRYGKSSIMLNEKINISDKFAFGFRAIVSPLKDNYEDKLLTESRLYAIFGPSDLKLALSYDFVRDIAHLDLMFLVGTNSSRINFEKLTTKGAENAEQKKDFYKNSKSVKVEDLENI